MPILTGWGAPSITVLWERAVGFVLVAALIGMFAGSVLSFIVLPSLASHKVRHAC
jgi:competence protein ComGC